MSANIAKVLADLKLFGPAVMIAHGFKMSGCALGKVGGVAMRLLLVIKCTL